MAQETLRELILNPVNEIPAWLEKNGISINVSYRSGVWIVGARSQGLTVCCSSSTIWQAFELAMKKWNESTAMEKAFKFATDKWEGKNVI